MKRHFIKLILCVTFLFVRIDFRVYGGSLFSQEGSDSDKVVKSSPQRQRENNLSTKGKEKAPTPPSSVSVLDNNVDQKSHHKREKRARQKARRKAEALEAAETIKEKRIGTFIQTAERRRIQIDRNDLSFLAERFKDRARFSVTENDSNIVTWAMQLTQDQELQIEGPLGADGIKALIHGLQCPAAGLAVLHLHVPNINDDHAILIAEALRDNTSLRILTFTGANLTHVGIMALLKGSPVTFAVYDNKNVVVDAQVFDIIDTLKKAPSRFFNVSESLFTSYMVSQLKEAGWEIF